MRLFSPCLLVLLCALPARAQVAQRVASVQNGAALFSFTGKPGVCGDGDELIGRRDLTGRFDRDEGFVIMRDRGRSSHFRGRGSWMNDCRPGPVYVRVQMRGGRATSAQVFAGPAPRGNATSLGRVPARDAANYTLTLAMQLSDEEAAKDMMLAAVFADSAQITPQLTRIAREPSRPEEVRESAVFFLSQTGEEAAVDALWQMVRAQPSDLGEKAVFGLSQHPSPRAASFLRQAAESRSFDSDLREKAIFWISQSGRDAAGKAQAREYLRHLYAQLDSDDLKEKVIFGVSQINDVESQRWLLDLARNEREPVDVREKAIFGAGQSDASLADISGLYDSLADEELKEKVIFALSQRKERAALDKLIAIARTDRNSDLRKKAMFWIGQSRDPRAAKFIVDVLNQ